MISINVIIELDPSKLEAAVPAMLANAEASRLEPGCLRFEVSRDLQRSNVFALSELYADPAAVEAHTSTAHFAAWRAGASAGNWILHKTSVRGEVI